MFYSEVVEAEERVDRRSGRTVMWAQLEPMCQDTEGEQEMLIGGYEQYNR
jgi:hypothetical protein